MDNRQVEVDAVAHQDRVRVPVKALAIGFTLFCAFLVTSYLAGWDLY